MEIRRNHSIKRIYEWLLRHHLFLSFYCSESNLISYSMWGVHIVLYYNRGTRKIWYDIRKKITTTAPTTMPWLWPIWWIKIMIIMCRYVIYPILLNNTNKMQCYPIHILNPSSISMYILFPINTLLLLFQIFYAWNAR